MKIEKKLIAQSSSEVVPKSCWLLDIAVACPTSPNHGRDLVYVAQRSTREMPEKIGFEKTP